LLLLLFAVVVRLGSHHTWHTFLAFATSWQMIVFL
jgi:hypothetical protein